jgi:hypothetical protein
VLCAFPRERGGAAVERGAHGAGRDLALPGCFREGLALFERIDAERPDLDPGAAVRAPT